MDIELRLAMDLHTACSLGDEEFVKHILDSKTVDVNARNGSWWSPLMYACWGGHDAVAGLLVQAGASRVELNNDNQTPLMLAAKSGCLDIVKLTFQRDILNHMDINGKTALYYAVEFSYLDIINYLLVEGANINLSFRGATPSMIAPMAGRRPLVELLGYRGHGQGNDQGRSDHRPASSHSHLDVAPQQDFTALKGFLKSLSLEKYWPVFESHNIDLQTFLNLNENDFKSLGIELLGPRRKMSLAIAAFLKHQSNPRI